MLKKNFVFGVGITNETEDHISEFILSGLNKSSEKYYIVTPNPEIVMFAQKNPHYKKIINEAKIALPDGIGVFLASALSGYPFKERITGVDFMEELCKRSSISPVTVGFLGGRDGVAELTAKCLKKKYPWIRVGFVGEEWGDEGFINKESHQVIKSSSHKVKRPEDFRHEGLKTSIDILFVAFGHPKQEEWIYENLEHLPVKVAMGVGGAFDYISGQVHRAPYMVRAMGFEWLYRLIKEPWRWRRQLALPRFVWLVLKEKFRGPGFAKASHFAKASRDESAGK